MEVTRLTHLIKPITFKNVFPVGVRSFALQPQNVKSVLDKLPSYEEFTAKFEEEIGSSGSPEEDIRKFAIMVNKEIKKRGVNLPPPSYLAPLRPLREEGPDFLPRVITSSKTKTGLEIKFHKEYINWITHIPEEKVGVPFVPIPRCTLLALYSTSY
jgi:hypothetical protein